MQKLGIILITAIVLFATACNNNTQEAIEYNNTIANEQIAIQEKINILDKSFENYIPEEMEESYSKAVLQLKNSTEIVKNLDDFNGDASLKKAGLNFFVVYQDILDNYYSKIVENLSKHDSIYSETDKELLLEINEEMQNIFNPAFDAFLKSQEDFSKKYEFEIDR